MLTGQGICCRRYCCLWCCDSHASFRGCKDSVRRSDPFHHSRSKRKQGCSSKENSKLSRIHRGSTKVSSMASGLLGRMKACEVSFVALAQRYVDLVCTTMNPSLSLSSISTR